MFLFFGAAIGAAAAAAAAAVVVATTLDIAVVIVVAIGMAAAKATCFFSYILFEKNILCGTKNVLNLCSDGLLNRGIYMENDFDFGGAENHNDVDLFMRFNTGIKNGADRDRPEFYTDMNGFQMQRRRLVRQVNIEGNYFPVSTMTYLEDQDARLTLVVDHGMGAAAWERGWLEVMVDRRSSFDDSRGMGEGVLDNRQTKHRYWLLYEPRDPADRHPGEEVLSLPSQAAAALSRRLNSPVVQYTGSSPRDFMPQ